MTTANFTGSTNESSNDLIDAISRAELLARETGAKHHVFWTLHEAEQFTVTEDDRHDGDLVYTSLVGS